MIATEAIRRKITRGAVLMSLYEAQCTPLLVQTIERMLTPVNPEIDEDMSPCVNFLLDRGYVKIWKESEADSERPIPHSLLLQITDKGQDVCEGTIRDAGIILPKAGRR